AHPRRLAGGDAALRAGDAAVAGAGRPRARRELRGPRRLRAGQLRLEAARDPHGRSTVTDAPRSVDADGVDRAAAGRAARRRRHRLQLVGLPAYRAPIDAGRVTGNWQSATGNW